MTALKGSHAPGGQYASTGYRTYRPGSPICRSHAGCRRLARHLPGVGCAVKAFDTAASRAHAHSRRLISPTSWRRSTLLVVDPRNVHVTQDRQTEAVLVMKRVILRRGDMVPIRQRRGAGLRLCLTSDLQSIGTPGHRNGTNPHDARRVAADGTATICVGLVLAERGERPTHPPRLIDEPLFPGGGRVPVRRGSHGVALGVPTGLGYLRTSRDEGLAWSTSEATTIGLSVVSTETGGSLDRFAHDKTGLVVNQKLGVDIASVSQVLTSLGSGGQMSISEGLQSASSLSDRVMPSCFLECYGRPAGALGVPSRFR